MKKLIIFLSFILVSCSETEPVDIKILDFKKNNEESTSGVYFYLNKPYSGPFFEREKDKNGFTDFYYLGEMVNGIKHGDIIKFKDKNENPILRNTYNNGKIIGPLVFYNSNGDGYVRNDMMFKVILMDFDVRKLSNQEIIFYINTENLVMKTFFRQKKPDSFRYKSLENKGEVGNEYDIWYTWSKQKISLNDIEKFSSYEKYYFTEFYRDIFKTKNEISDYSFNFVGPNEITLKEITMLDNVNGVRDTLITNYTLNQIKIDSLILSSPEKDIPRNSEFDKEIEELLKKEYPWMYDD
ncbi:MAG: hypothetical protein CL888_00240 [Dehalococcoidia bacterium]|nr:hypothetical protein [Dehalococcoidia bacterium]